MKIDVEKKIKKLSIPNLIQFGITGIVLLVIMGNVLSMFNVETWKIFALSFAIVMSYVTLLITAYIKNEYMKFCWTIMGLLSCFSGIVYFIFIMIDVMGAIK